MTSAMSLDIASPHRRRCRKLVGGVGKGVTLRGSADQGLSRSMGAAMRLVWFSGMPYNGFHEVFRGVSDAWLATGKDQDGEACRSLGGCDWS